MKSTIQETYGYNSEAEAGDQVKSYECDITLPSSVDKAFAAIAEDNVAFPSILINSGGYVNLNALEDFPPEDSLKHYMINLYGPYFNMSSVCTNVPQAKAIQRLCTRRANSHTFKSSCTRRSASPRPVLRKQGRGHRTEQMHGK